MSSHEGGFQPIGSIDFVAGDNILPHDVIPVRTYVRTYVVVQAAMSVVQAAVSAVQILKAPSWLFRLTSARASSFVRPWVSNRVDRVTIRLYMYVRSCRMRQSMLGECR